MPTVLVNGDAFFVEVTGEGAPPLLLVHGFPLDHSMWNAQLAHFSKTHRVIAPDLRGFGASVVTSGTVTMEQHADDLANLLEAIDIEQPVVFCGLSMGGYVAWQFWRKYAQRVAAMILCDTRAVADTEIARQGRLAMAERVVLEGSGIVATGMLPKLVAADSDPRVMESIRQMIVNTNPEAIAAAQRGMAQRPDVTDQLSGITVPTLVLVGTHDEISRVDEMREIASAIPNSRFAEIPAAGHMAPMENPTAVNAAIGDFLDEI